MTSLETIKKFLDEVPAILLGDSKIEFLKPINLNRGQEGYRFDLNGKSLITEKDGDWKENWLVVGSDSSGDPIIIDTSSPNLVVLSAPDADTWYPIIIADSLDKFKEIISLFAIVSRHRTTSDDLDTDPINEDERRSVLQAIKNLVPGSDIRYWELFLDHSLI